MTRTIFLAAGAALFLSTPVKAEDYTVDQLRALFQRQLDAYTEIETTGLGATRGLKLVTVEEEAVETPSTGVDVASTAQVASAGGDASETFGLFDPELQVNLHIEFAFDSAALGESERPKLETLCTVLQTSEIDHVQIVGHTDASGTAEYNERLSVLRAEEVQRYLVDSCGIDAVRLEAIGLGERFPFNRENPRADENRRVEFQALG